MNKTSFNVSAWNEDGGETWKRRCSTPPPCSLAFFFFLFFLSHETKNTSNTLFPLSGHAPHLLLPYLHLPIAGPGARVPQSNNFFLEGIPPAVGTAGCNGTRAADGTLQFLNNGGFNPLLTA